MKDLQEIWDSIPEENSDYLDGVIDAKSISEVDKIKKLLKVELVISWFCLVVTMLLRHLVQVEVLIFLVFLVVVASLLNLFVLNRLKDQELFKDVFSFIKNSIITLQAFVVSFLVLIQVFLFFSFFLLKANMNFSTAMKDDFYFRFGSVAVLINVLLFAYAWYFYVRRIKALKGLLHDVEES